MSKRKFKKRSFNKKHLSLAKLALRRVQRLRKQLQPEPKFHDILATTLLPGAAGIMTNLCLIAGGNTVTTRIGNMIRPFFMEFRCTVTKDVTPTTSPIRMLIVRDNRQVESTIPSLLDILLQAVPMSPYSRVNPKRFTILWNKFFILRTNRIATTINITKKLNFPMQYIGAVNTDITRNGIFLLLQSSNVAGQLPTIVFTFRLRFTDV